MTLENMLLYKTRANSSPNNKSKVYLCCHDEDIDKYIDEVSNDILDKQNCVIYYKNKSNYEYSDEFYELLLKMNLFVIPITSKLLTKGDIIITNEFKFAIKNRIPVLPLMQEGNLEEMFNQKFGDIQYLDKHNTDTTTISFDEKLDKYLKSVLISDELANKVRNAFDAYIFLSYRKKDRKYANELMRRIHKNDFTRDIAIWYDEYLTPGENFNDLIKEMITKSDLFMLTVTPRVVDEDNYIIKYEYPFAEENNKLILPVEVEKTNVEELNNKYNNLPNIVNIDNEEDINIYLRKIINEEKNNDPEHNYLIGLAYLSGIDVEVDHQKALELLEQSANSDYVPSLDKLADMYKTGEGVEKDHNKIIDYLDRIVKILQNKYNNDKCPDNQVFLSYYLLKLGDAYIDIGKVLKAKEHYEMIIRLDDDSCKSISFKQTLSVAYNKIGDIYLDNNQITEGKDSYIKSLNIRDSINKKVKTIGSLRDLGVSFGRLGDISIKLGDLQKAKEYYQKLLDIFEKIYKTTKTTQAKKDLVIPNEKLADIYYEELNMELAKRYYQKALDISLELLEETKAIGSKMDVSFGYQKIADVYQRESDISKAKLYYKMSLNLIREVVHHANTIDSKRNLSVAYEKMGDILKKENDLYNAKVYYRDSITIREDIYEDTKTILSQRDLIVSYNKLGDIYMSEGYVPTAKIYYQRALVFSEKLFYEHKSLESKRDLSITLSKLGDIYYNDNNISEAKNYYVKAMDLFSEIYNEIKTLDAKKNLGIIYEKMGYIYEKQGDMTKAREYYVNLLIISTEICNETKTPESYDSLGVAYYILGCVDMNKEYVIIALNIFATLCREYPNYMRYYEAYQTIYNTLQKFK